MTPDTQSRPDAESREVADRPAVRIRESAPGTAVFVESGNTDGWIASDTTSEVTR